MLQGAQITAPFLRLGRPDRYLGRLSFLQLTISFPPIIDTLEATIYSTYHTTKPNEKGTARDAREMAKHQSEGTGVQLKH